MPKGPHPTAAMRAAAMPVAAMRGIVPFSVTIAALEKLGATNNHTCTSCEAASVS